MKKVHIPGSVYIGILICAVCLFGLFQKATDIDLPLIAALVVAVIFIVIFCRKNVQVVETKQVVEGRKPGKSKFVAAKEKDEVHQRKLLDLYMYQKEEYRLNARNGVAFGAVGFLIVFLMWGYGKLSLPVFAALSVFCVYYAGRCIWLWFINSDKPEARNIAARLNMTTLQDQIEYTEQLIFQSEERERMNKTNGTAEDTVAFIDKKEYLEDKDW
ncbi:MAG: hypothetical protein J6X94_10050 [Lachnospiraceae bacterium]|nr:hypothetical protein [Lachnospiraceae bacterium]